MKKGQQMIWITSWPHGIAKLVTIAGANPNIAGGIYILKAEGGSDTTTEDFLFPVPYGLQMSKEVTSWGSTIKMLKEEEHDTQEN